MRILALLLVATLTIASCKQAVDEHEFILSLGQKYYDYLLKGNYGAYIDATYRYQALDADARQELIDNLEMFVYQQRTRGGITSAEAQSVDLDTARHEAIVFLKLSYGNGDQQMVSLPLVQHNDIWYLR